MLVAVTCVNDCGHWGPHRGPHRGLGGCSKLCVPPEVRENTLHTPFTTGIHISPERGGCHASLPRPCSVLCLLTLLAEV